jgi:hypothetical protein
MHDHPEVKVDSVYYLTNQLQKRLEGILSLLPVPSVERLFDTAVAQVRARGLDTSAISRLCISRDLSDTHLKTVRVSKKKAGGRLSKKAADAATSTLTGLCSHKTGGREAPPNTPMKRSKPSKAVADQTTANLLSFFS